jgi:excinuclease UvrABC nuclease subunit
VQSLDQLIVASRLAEPEPREAVGRARSVMDRALLADIPKKPGCYIMRDALEQVIYVGKSKNLRDRVASYFSQPLGYTRKMDGLLESVHRIETAVVGSEIEAMLLESQLIHRYAPRYNTAMRSFEHYPYIKVDLANPWPRITVSKTRKDDGARYFGPYQSASGARKTVDTLNKILPLRTCTRSFKTASSYGNPCIQLGIGKCMGPCDGKADREEYRAMVNDVVQFLDGHESSIHQRIWSELEEASARLDFERARRLRSDLLSMNGIVEAHKRMRLARERHTFLLVLPSAEADCREALMIIQGRIWKQTRLPRELEADSLGEEASRMATSYARGRAAGDADVNQYSADERHILNRWLARNSEHPALLDIDETRAADPGFWGELLRAALAFEDDELVFNDRDVRRSDTDSAEPDPALPDPDSV